MPPLTAEQQERVERLFEQALERTDDDRAALLDAECDDAVVRTEVESLLAARPAADRVLKEPIADSGLVADALRQLSPPPDCATDADKGPQQIGPYRIVSKLGEGGMGTVYLAEQTEPLMRRVAIKLIKLGMDTRSVLRRFESERQALALMNHPNVARVFDAGATEKGRPYFVMELVEGTRITTFCDDRRMNTAARLGLFLEVCAAIQHAHQKGIIHRDIKPSNVLAFQDNGGPTAKVIDFGVAKATEQRLTRETMFTEQGVLIGTPEYMSPEQADPTATDIDTRSDVYSLGVVLYELLVGAVPLDTGSSAAIGFDDVRRIIREQDPLRPSTRLSGHGAIADAAARNRGTTLSTLERRVRGDLDWIVMKCLEKDRDRRYATIAELSDDIQRHLHDEPVSAGPPSVRYRARKFARRNRALVGATLAVFVALTAGIVSTTVFAFRESRQRATAEAQAETARAINKFLNEMLASVDPKQANGRDIGVLRDILDEAATKVKSELSDQPQVQASVSRTIGKTYTNLGLYAEAEPHLENALAIQRAIDDEPTVDVANSLFLLGILRDNQGRYQEAESLMREAIDMQREVLGPESDPLVASLNHLAMVMLRTGRFDDAKMSLDEAVSIVETTHEPDDILSLDIRNTLAGYFSKRGDYAEAEMLFRKMISAMSDRPDDPDLLAKQHNLATVLKKEGKFDESAALFVKALEGTKRVFGPEHRLTLAVSNGLASVMELQGRHAESEALQREVLTVRRRTLGENHPDVQASLNNLGSVLHAQGRLDESIAVLREALAIAREIRSPDHPLLAMAQAQVGFVLRETRDPQNYPEAEQLIQSALAILDKSLPPSHPIIANTLRGLRRLYGDQAMDDPVKLAEIQTRLDAFDDAQGATPRP